METRVVEGRADFLDMCGKCDGMKIVEVLNTVFGIFDHLSDKNAVYKVETVKDSFVGVSGAPDRVGYVKINVQTLN